MRQGEKRLNLNFSFAVSSLSLSLSFTFSRPAYRWLPPEQAKQTNSKAKRVRCCIIHSQEEAIHSARSVSGFNEVAKCASGEVGEKEGRERGPGEG